MSFGEKAEISRMVRYHVALDEASPFSSAIISGVKIEQRDNRYEYHVNFAEAFKTCRNFLRIHDSVAEMEVESLIAQNIEPIRPGRTFARQYRFKLPISFCYRN